MAPHKIVHRPRRLLSAASRSCARPFDARVAKLAASASGASLSSLFKNDHDVVAGVSDSGAVGRTGFTEAGHNASGAFFPQALRRFGLAAVAFALGLGFLLVAAPWGLAQTAPPGFTVSTYATNLPASGGITGLAIDTATRTIYYGEQNTIGALRKIAPNRTVTIVAPNMVVAPNNDASFYPYVATDLEYYEGGVYYIAGAPGNLERVDATTGEVTVVTQIPGSGNECGITIHDGALYATDGDGSRNSLLIVDLESLVPLASNLPALSSSLEYNAIKDRYYFTDVSGARIMQVTPSGVVTLLGTGTGSGSYNLAVDPSGAAVYVASGTTVRRYDTTTTGAGTTFVTGLGDSSFKDLVFGPSSTSSGVSLYIGAGNRIVEVAGFNAPPTISAPDTITTDEDVAVDFTITITDPNGDPVTSTISSPAQGTLTVGVDSYLYTPNLDANGVDSFTIVAIDDKGGKASKTVSVIINPVNDAPIFANAPETLTTDEDTAINFVVSATDADGDLVTLGFSDAIQGEVNGTAGSYTYTPNPNANGAGTFTIIATDGNGGRTTKAVSVTINPVNDAPIFTNVPQTLTTDEDTATNFGVSATDADGDLVALSFSDVTHGVVSGSEGNYAYMPNPNANGTGSFTVTASDGNGGMTNASVSVTIQPVNDAPVFTTVPATLTTDEDAATNFTVATDDADGNSVAVSVSGAAKGAVSGSAGNYTYAPNPDANGSDSFTVTADDGNGGTTSASVSVTITAINDAPVFTDIPTTLTTDKKTARNFTVATTDVEGDPVTVAFTGAVKGIVSGSAPEYTYTPNAGVTGGDNFTVTATDGRGGTTTAMVQVTIVGYPASYALLLGDASGVHAALTLRLSGRGLLTGSVRDENNQRVQVQRTLLPPDGTAATLSLKDGSSLALQFDTKRRLNATLTMSGRELSGVGNVAVVPPDEVPGRYTMVLDTGSGGFGWCSLVVNKRGGVRILGKLPDGSAIIANQGMPIDRENDTPLFLLGKAAAKALLSGSLHFAVQTQSDVTGSLKFRKGGNDTECEASGAHFTAAKSALPPGTYPLVFEGVEVSQTTAVILGSDNSAAVTRPVVSLTPGGGTGHRATGVFNVKFRAAGAGGTAPGPLLFGSGVFIQKLGKGFGQFIKDGATGQVLIGQ